MTTASFVAGHLGRLGARDDVTVHQQYIADTAVGPGRRWARDWRGISALQGGVEVNVWASTP